MITRDVFSCIAVDMGAGSIRIMLGSIDKSGLTYKEVHRITNEIVDYQGHQRWDMNRMVSEIKSGIEKAIRECSTAPVSIGVDSWGVDFVLLDDTWDLVEMPVAYRDSRTEGMQELWKSEMSEMETFQQTGINFYIFNTLFQILSMRDSEILSATSHILFVPSYINYLLSGKAMNELTISSTSQMLGIDGNRWDEKILASLKLDRSMLGEVVLPGSKLGKVIIPEAGGLQIESIAVCGHDTACAIAALPVENLNFAYISSGTWCIIGVESASPLLSEDALNEGFTNERGYNNSYRSLKNIVGLWLLQGLKKHLREETTFSQMEEMTQLGAHTNHIINPEDPLFYNPDDMKLAFDAFFNKTGQQLPDDINGYIRCAYNSLCFSFRYHLEKLVHLSGKVIEVLHLIGGGSQSDYLNQKVADICMKKVIAGPVEGATIGNILVQAMAMGKIENLDEARKLVKESFPGKVYNSMSQGPATEKQYAHYLQLKNN